MALHGDEWRCGYHLPSFSTRTRLAAFEDFGSDAARDRALERQRVRHQLVNAPRPAPAPPAPRPKPEPKPRGRPRTPIDQPVVKVVRKPDHYKVVAISLYTADEKRLGDLVAAARAAGVRRATKSGLIRYALTLVEVNKLPEVLP